MRWLARVCAGLAVALLVGLHARERRWLARIPVVLRRVEAPRFLVFATCWGAACERYRTNVNLVRCYAGRHADYEFVLERLDGSARYGCSYQHHTPPTQISLIDDIPVAPLHHLALNRTQEPSFCVVHCIYSWRGQLSSMTLLTNGV